jgi:AcrR family transcriptional regulator
MVESVKPDGVTGRVTKRRYDASRRREQARHNRAAVLQVARVRFLAQGYAATTLPDVARDAGVSVETVYKAFTSKAGLLKAVFDVSVAGDDEPVPMAERDVIRDVIAAPDAATKITLYAKHIAETMPRAAPVQLLARDAAAADAAAGDVLKQTRKEMLAGMTAFARNLAGTGQLRVSVNEARDLLWTYHSPELYELLVLERRWSAKRYGDFLARALVDALVRAG